MSQKTILIDKFDNKENKVKSINFKFDVNGTKAYEFTTTHSINHPDAGLPDLFRIEKNKDGYFILIASEDDYYIYDDVTVELEKALGLKAKELFQQFEKMPDVPDSSNEYQQFLLQDEEAI